MLTQAEFLQANDVNGRLTPEQFEQMMNLHEGDTSTTLEKDGAPRSITDKADAEASLQDDLTNVDSEKAGVVLAKDGVHTIPYERLTEAREGEKHWKAQAAAATAQLEALQAQADQREAAGTAATATDNATALATAAIASGEVDPEIFGDFSEAALAKGVQILVDARVDARVNEVMEKLDAKLQPFQAQQAKTAQELHYGAIYGAHPDADSISESAELAEWIDKQPSFAKAGYQSVLQKGTAEQIVEFFTSFKESTAKTQTATSTKPDAAAAAEKAIAGARSKVPASLSDFPGSVSGPSSKFEAMEAMSPASIVDAMSSMSPQQIEAYLNRQI